MRPLATAEDTIATLLVYERADKKWAWHLEADNGQIVATDGGQGYENEVDCQAEADAIVINGAYKNARRMRRGTKQS